MPAALQIALMRVSARYLVPALVSTLVILLAAACRGREERTEALADTLGTARRLTTRVSQIAPWFAIAGPLVQARAAILLGERPNADVVAIRPLRCAHLAGHDLQSFLVAHPHVMYRMLLEQTRRVRNANLWRR